MGIAKVGGTQPLQNIPRSQEVSNGPANANQTQAPTEEVSQGEVGGENSVEVTQRDSSSEVSEPAQVRFPIQTNNFAFGVDGEVNGSSSTTYGPGEGNGQTVLNESNEQNYDIDVGLTFNTREESRPDANGIVQFREWDIEAGARIFGSSESNISGNGSSESGYELDARVIRSGGATVGGVNPSADRLNARFDRNDRR